MNDSFDTMGFAGPRTREAETHEEECVMMMRDDDDEAWWWRDEGWATAARSAQRTEQSHQRRQRHQSYSRSERIRTIAVLLLLLLDPPSAVAVVHRISPSYHASDCTEAPRGHPRLGHAAHPEEGHKAA